MYVRAIMIALLSLAVAGIAEAETLYSSALRVEDGIGKYYRCRVLNISNKTVNVTIEIHGSDGTLLSSDSPSIDPGHVSTVDFIPTTNNHTAWCKVHVDVQFSVRAVHTIQDSDDTTVVAVEVTRTDFF